MGALSEIGVLLGGSWASGINLYLTVAGLGIAGRAGWIDLPGNMDIISNPLIIGLASLMFLVEFVADKIPLVDSAWDSVHSFIRPAGAALMGYSAMSGSPEIAQMAVAMASGTVALDSHLTKATARAAINTSPEPFSNSIASVSEDTMVIGVLWLIAKHPVIATVFVVAFIIFSIWFLKVMYRFLRGVFRFILGKKDEPGDVPAEK